jgi:hypothetical protein
MFSGMEFTLTFLTFDRFSSYSNPSFGFTNIQQGKLLAFMGVLTAAIQGGWVRRTGVNRERKLVLQGISSCALGLFIIGSLAKTSTFYLYLGVSFLAVTSGTVVTCLTSLASFETSGDGANRGKVLGNFRSSGQLGRCLGPMIACTAYWILGSEKAYTIVAVGMTILFFIAMTMIKAPTVVKNKKE